MQTLPSPDGARIYTSSFVGLVSVLDTVTGRVVGTIPHQLVDFRVGISLSRDGRWLATTDTKHLTRIRDSRTLRAKYELPRGFHVKAFSPDGTHVLVAATAPRKGPPRVLEVATGRTVFRLDGSGDIEGAEWSPDGSLLATASFDHFARVHDARSGEQLAEIPSDRYEATDVSFRPDGSQLAISSHDVVIVDVEALRDRRVEVVATLPNRSGSTNIQSLQFAADGSELVTSSLSLELAVWNASSWEPKYTIRGPYSTPSMSLPASGGEVVSAGLGGPGLVVYTLDVDRLIEIARSRLTRPLTTAECIRYMHLDECPMPEPQ
jgi:WD40 repeat protein